ncbi:hypothetical protein GCM10011316_14530 [Roseibium aquae]|uniref:PIN domain-containing protein n=1 Tax=Roseibium aquae TaxID=1323746 RepID=A0A916TG65_9HYPH|nr:type II toxin-antitoxin system VapC family toxin [Roseibium aquae]GGB43668.1 hypothetical protein GCM10011316_14530 [Roseibium aquae]
MSYLIDTNIISEVRKGERCDPAVATWWAGVAEDDLWLSALVLGEIRKGVELVRRRDPRKAEALEAWLGDVIAGFGDRVLPVDTAVAEEWGRMNAIRPVPVIRAISRPIRQMLTKSNTSALFSAVLSRSVIKVGPSRCLRPDGLAGLTGRSHPVDFH